MQAGNGNAIPIPDVCKVSQDQQLEVASVEIQAEWDFEMPDLAEDVPARGSRALEQMTFKSPFNMKPFCGSVKCLELPRRKE